LSLRQLAIRKHGKSENIATAKVCPQIDWNMEEIQKGLGADRVLTEEEMELINEFLHV